MSDVVRVQIPRAALLAYEPVSAREVALMELAMRYAVQADRAALARQLPIYVQDALQQALQLAINGERDR